ncbi:hypothetical protein [Aquisphaera giovannonii]|uniref:hypothetical protein n=1 Tax=Aquisphaera giovannonii TaxID=406548 RepID=UPI00143DEE6C|nr:hypothetical protein [Aquisphaera giovannonii]
MRVAIGRQFVYDMTTYNATTYNIAEAGDAPDEGARWILIATVERTMHLRPIIRESQ